MARSRIARLQTLGLVALVGLAVVGCATTSDGLSVDPERRWGDRYWALTPERVIEPVVQPTFGRPASDGLEPVPGTSGWSRYRDWVGEGTIQTAPFTRRPPEAGTGPGAGSA